MLAAARLSKSLVTPQRIASVLDWKQIGGAVMALDLTSKNTVGVAIAPHPTQSATVHALEPIQLVDTTRNNNKAVISDEAVQHLEDLIREHKVCGFVVGWPLQPEGRPGKPCGRVLHVLDVLTEKRGTMLTKNRPFTLWDDRYVPREDGADSSAGCPKDDEAPDSWGRSVAFSRTPIYSAELGEYLVSSSVERSQRPAVLDSSDAGGVLRHFMGSFWEPSLSDSEEERRTLKRTTNKAFTTEQEKKLFDSFEEYNDEKVCIEEALL